MWHGALFRVALFAFGVYWCVRIIRRLPSDLRELREHYARYRGCKDPAVLATMESAERRRHYQQDCARDFWTSLAVQLLFFWPVTLIAMLLVVLFLWEWIARVGSALS